MALNDRTHFPGRILFPASAGLCLCAVSRKAQAQAAPPLAYAEGHWPPEAFALTGVLLLAVAILLILLLRARRTVASLRISEERYRILMDQVEAVSIQGYSSDGIVSYWNDSSETIYGYTREEALGKNLVDLIIPPPMREEVRKAILQMGETGQPLPASELILMHKDGSDVPVFSTHSVVTTADGETVQYCLDVDLSALKDAEKALRASEERFRLLVENAGDAIYLTDMRGRILEVNPEAERQTGFGREELLGMNMMDLDETQSPEALAAFARSISSERRACFETRHRRKDGGSFPVDLRVVFLEVGAQKYVLGLARDITTRKRDEELITEANKTLTTILDGLCAAVNVVDIETHEILFMNKAMKETFRRDCTGETCYRSFREREAVCDNCWVPGACPSGEPPDEMVVWEDMNPVTGLWGLNHDRALRWIDGRMVRVQVTIDISERKRAEERMEASLHEKEILLREIHHRVKNNLQIISSLLNLQKQAVANPTAQSVLDESRGRIASMAMIHEQLYRSRDFAGLDVGEYLGQFLPRLVSACKGDREISLVLETAEIPLSLEQAIPFGLILNELATNAIKHGFRRRTRGTLHVAAALVDGEVLVEVEDDGEGMPPGVSLSAPDTLGLQLVVSLAEQLKGRVSVDSPNGVRFRLRFPVVRNGLGPD
ncbi:PAS domain S-box protein [Fundidesulfovibrio putealis]|uniref:PAS domain S-box protein n=1 Tax=Fundidesulfovibrio putealis TaxID=270496 RepID=UPI00041B86A0|nr:PAS domain S-box protein [Fundidesulfovibrio putealis]